MRFPDSTLFALNVPTPEPMRRGRLFVLAVALTLAAMSTAMLVEAEGLESVIGGAKGTVGKATTAVVKTTA